MTISSWLILALWLTLLVYWVVLAGDAKRNLKGGWVWRREAGIRLGILVLVVLAVRVPAFDQLLRRTRALLADTSPLIAILGVVLCAIGVGLAIWARVHLGRNWGMPMSQKENPELVTTGPYAIVRHPIYTGFLVAMLGSAIGQNVVWLVPLVVCGVYFIFSARREERLMIAEFPMEYPAYMRRTKMLVPFLL